MARKHSHRKLVRVYSPLFNLETGLAGLVSSALVLLINWWGTGILVWGAAFVRLVISLSYNALLPKIGEHLTHVGNGKLSRQFWGNFVPNTVAMGIHVPIFFALDVPRPWLSILPFWFLSLITFTQVVKYSKNGYEPGVLDILHGLWEDVMKLFKKK